MSSIFQMEPEPHDLLSIDESYNWWSGCVCPIFLETLLVHFCLHAVVCLQEEKPPEKKDENEQPKKEEEKKEEEVKKTEEEKKEEEPKKEEAQPGEKSVVIISICLLVFSTWEKKKELCYCGWGTVDKKSTM